MALFDTTFAPYVPLGSRTLTPGAEGTDVAVVQAVYNLMLGTMTPATGPIGAPVTIDGVFGGATQAAVRGVQGYFGIPVTGTVGPDTYLVFGQAVGAHTSFGGPVYGSRELTVGASGGDVTVLQNRLNCFRYASLLAGPATGAFGSGTTAAVLAFKTDAAANGDTGFPDNGIAGFGFYNASWLYALAGGRTLATGDAGFDVVFVQVLLQSLDYYAGPITGFYDAATAAAVAAFQSARGIAADGTVGLATFYQFGTQSARAAPRPLAVAWPPAPPVPVCTNGIDSNTNLASVAACLKGAGYAFVGRYLGGPCYSGVRLTPAEAAAMSAAGLQIASIYVGANTVAAFTCGRQTLAQGQSDAAAAVGLARMVGQPTGSAIYLDLQGDQTSRTATWLAYVQGWTQALAGGGYQPGVYSSPEQLSLIHDQPWGGDALFYWPARMISSGPMTPAPCPSTELSYAQVWQYSLDQPLPACRLPDVDFDSAEPEAGFWTADGGGTGAVGAAAGAARPTAGGDAEPPRR